MKNGSGLLDICPADNESLYALLKDVIEDGHNYHITLNRTSTFHRHKIGRISIMDQQIELQYAFVSEFFTNVNFLLEKDLDSKEVKIKDILRFIVVAYLWRVARKKKRSRISRSKSKSKQKIPLIYELVDSAEAFLYRIVAHLLKYGQRGHCGDSTINRNFALNEDHILNLKLHLMVAWTSLITNSDCNNVKYA